MTTSIHNDPAQQNRDTLYPLRLGVILPELGKLNIAALKYLILHLNTLQNHVQFEFYTPDLTDEFLRKLAPKLIMDWDYCLQEAPKFFMRNAAYLNNQNKSYGLSEPIPDHFIIISLATLSNHWYSSNLGGNSLIFLGDWKRQMSPPSLLEFILTLVITSAVYTISPKLDLPRTHLGTKGCIWDFNSDLRDVRYKTLEAFMCDYCRDICRRNGVEQKVNNLIALLQKDWLGSTADARSPAGVVAKLGYDLFLTKGITPTHWEAARSTLREEGVKQALQFIAAIILAAIFLWLGLEK